MSSFTKEYFIAKFELIPEDRWATGQFESYTGRHCALGFCGVDSFCSRPSQYSPEPRALIELFWPADCHEDNADMRGIVAISDGKDKRYQQPTPKARVLAALRDLP